MSQIQSDHPFPFPQGPAHLVLPSQTQTSTSRQVGSWQMKLCSLHCLSTQCKWFASNSFLMKNLKKEGIPGLKAENSFLRLKIQIYTQM